jgi:hypothetical protein
MRQDSVSEQLGLPGAIVPPDFQHDVGAARIAVFFNPLDAFFRRPGNGADFTEDVVRDRFRRGFPSTFFHGVGDWPQLIEGQAGTFQQDVGRSPDILHFVRKIHRSLLASTFLSLG